MDRLTEKDSRTGLTTLVGIEGVYDSLSVSNALAIENALSRLSAYEDTGLPPEECADYAKAEAENRLVVLPSVKVFVLQYVRGNDCDNICPAKIDGVGLCGLCDKSELGICEERCEQRHLEYIGKSVFLTHEEAEKALEAQK